MNVWGFDEGAGVTEEDYLSAWMVIGAVVFASFVSAVSLLVSFWS